MATVGAPQPAGSIRRQQALVVSIPARPALRQRLSGPVKRVQSRAGREVFETNWTLVTLCCKRRHARRPVDRPASGFVAAGYVCDVNMPNETATVSDHLIGALAHHSRMVPLVEKENMRLAALFYAR